LALKGCILDSQTVGKKMKKPHHTARAGLTYNTIRTDTMKFDRKAVKAQLLQDFNVEHTCWEDKEDDYQLAPHQRSFAEREVGSGQGEQEVQVSRVPLSRGEPL
jgi:hypothetical protein